MITERDIIKIENADLYASYEAYLETIVETTPNTWQKERDSFSKTSDTEQGKLAENIVEIYIRSNFSAATYLSYDDLRTDEFKKTAPFDGLIFKKDIEENILRSLVKKINDEVHSNDFGQITDTLKQELLDKDVNIVEIKSTKIAERHYDKNELLYELILNDDFLEYPKFTRKLKKDQSINGWDEYLNYCKTEKNICLKCSTSFLKNTIEFNHMRHYNVRVYIDYKTNIAYIIGAIYKRQFIDTSTIKPMIKKNKSEDALYIATNLKNGIPFDALEHTI